MKKQNVVVDSTTGEVFELPKIRRQRTAHLDKVPREKNTMPSETKPSMTMSVLEMIKRHRQGLPVMGNNGGQFNGDQELPDLDQMDLIDRADYMDAVAEALVEVKARIAASVKTKQQKEFLDKVEEEVKLRLAAIKPKEPGQGSPSA